MAAYYNEIEPYAAEWLRNLIKTGLILDGEVDTRSIIDVSADDLRGFTQCHFFAGIGGWARALRLAGWPDDRPIWTGSCPCQPFSVAGKGLGTDDPRHLWPHFFRLVRAARPPVVMGEQVAGAAGYGWFDGVAADLESENYASRAVDIPACAVDAPHIRSRLYWVASDMANASRIAKREQDDDQRTVTREDAWVSSGGRSSGHASSIDMADASHERRDRLDALLRTYANGRDAQTLHEASGRRAGDMADASSQRELAGSSQRASNGGCGFIVAGTEQGRDGVNGRDASHTFWSNAIWLTGADGKARRAEPSIPLLAHGIPARVGRLRAYGNAIVPQVAAEVIAAFMEMEA